MHNNPLLSSWLTHEGSLTDKLKSYTPNVHLQVLQHAWQEHLLERRVIIWAGTEPCWFARTQIPRITFTAEQALFARLETHSLGELIWHNPRIVRTNLQYFSITPHTLEYALLDHNLHEQREILWARFSTLLAQGQYPFDLLEIFLPGLERVLT